jgi:serine phosphatase RsbU (regulator of sigma subunit)
MPDRHKQVEDLVPALSETKANAQRHTILCVDDDPTILRSLKGQLTKHFRNSYPIETASGGEEALDVIHQMLEENQQIAVIISDQMMPSMLGSEFLRLAHMYIPRAKKILLTGQASFEGVVDAINKGQLYRFISKPWDTADLNLTVSEAIKLYNQENELEIRNRQLQDTVAQLQTTVQQLNKTNDYLEEMMEVVTSHTEEVLQQSQELKKKNNQITESLQYASKVQRSLLPSASAIRNVIPDSFIFSRPRDMVSGDFFWMRKTDDLTIVVTADCTGHGISAAMLTIMGSTFLDQIFNSHGTIQPGKLLQQLDEHIMQSFRLNGELGNSTAMDVVAYTIDYKRKTLTFAGAMNPAIYFKDDEMHHLKGDRIKIGRPPLKKNQAKPDIHEQLISLDTPVTIYTFTDGYKDQFGGPRGKKFMAKRFRELLEEIYFLPMSEQENILNHQFREWKGNYPQTDDVLVVGVHLDL